MDRRKLLLLVAAMVALAGTTLVVLYAKGADARAAERFDTLEVLRAVAPIAVGESIEVAAESGKVELQPVPEGQVLDGAQVDTDALSGKVALTTIYPGEQIVAARFGGAAEAATPDLPIPDGMLAVSVDLTDPARVAGFVAPGSEVAIFLNGTDPRTQAPYTRLLLERVQVLGVGSTTPVSTTTTSTDGQQTTEQLPRTLLTLAVDKAQVQRVLYASGNGELALGLLTTESDLPRDQGVTADNLFTGKSSR
ncbi:Flp pilus assembly protein CpaB [Nocardioides pacificus]